MFRLVEITLCLSIETILVYFEQLIFYKTIADVTYQQPIADVTLQQPILLEFYYVPNLGLNIITNSSRFLA